MKKATILGSTGSIGTQALSVISENPDQFSVYALSANRQITLLAEQARKFRPEVVAIRDTAGYSELKTALADTPIKVLAGEDALCELAADEKADIILNAVVGFAGLKLTLSALAAKNVLALANKESLVAGGHLVMPLAAANKTAIIPVDSEHSAIFQCLQGESKKAVETLQLTASGGPFFGRTKEELCKVTPQDALKHPNWTMGEKITIDSASMMNKGLEVIEAHWLFNINYDKIKVTIHRESIIHSMVSLCDGAVLAQLGVPDMRVPIQYALTYPSRLRSSTPRLDWEKVGKLHFAPPDHDNFPCLALAYSAGKAGGSLPAVMNAANEEAVRLFLSGRISFLAIPRIIEFVMNKHKLIPEPDYKLLVEADGQARELAREYADKERVKKC